MLADVLQNEPGFRTEQPRVLIVEDEFLIAMDIEDSILQAEEEADVIGIANRLEEAVALGSRADIAFVDVNLADGATGPDIGRHLAQEHGISVVFMTANPEAVADGVRGVIGVVQKPIMPRVVEQLLRYVAARRLGMLAAVPPQMIVFG